MKKFKLKAAGMAAFVGVLCSFGAVSDVKVGEFGPFVGEIVRVMDGDTLEIRLFVLPGLVKTSKIRLFGLDTPESTWRAKCDSERKLGLKAKKLLSETVGSGLVSVDKVSEGKYAGRLLGRVSVDGVDVADSLLAAGLAKPYFGGTKQGWCNE